MSQRSTGSCTLCIYANAFHVILFVQTRDKISIGYCCTVRLHAGKQEGNQEMVSTLKDVWYYTVLSILAWKLVCTLLHSDYEDMHNKKCRRIYILSTKVPTFFLVASVLQIQLLGYKIYPTYYRMHAFIIPRYAPDIRYITTIDGCGDGWHGCY